MSSQGQIDPVVALSQLQTGQQAGQIDPVQALAMGQHVPSPQADAQQQPSAWTDPKGYLSAGLRSFTNAAAFNLADPAAAAIGAAMPIKGYTSTKPTYGERYNELLGLSRGDTAAGQQAHPYVSLGASIAGGMVNPVSHSLPGPTSLGGAVAQGAGLGAAYGAGGAVGDSKDMGDALKQTATGAATGGIAGTAAYGLGKLLQGATRSAPAQLLHDEGVPLTPGQSLGGTAQTLEDASTHIPMMGNAIKSRQGDSIVGFNVAGYNRALEPLGIKYASGAPVGNEGLEKVGDIIGKAYDNAYNGAQVTQSPQLTADLGSAISDAGHVLPSSRVSQIQDNIDRFIISKFQGGQLSNDDLQYAKNWFSEQSRVGPTASKDEQAIGKAYGAVVDAIKDEIGANDPSRKSLLDAADTSFMRFVKLGQAASQNASSAKGGLITPSQLGAALRSTDNSTRRMNFATGTAPMQDLAQAGQQVLPSTVPDSGTAVRGLADLALLGGGGHFVAPEAVLPALGTIGGGTALYSKPGQKLAEALLFGAPGARRAMAAIPKTMLPGILAALQPVTAGNKP